MQPPKTYRTTAPIPGTPEFDRQMAEGLRRAPIERAKAVREFWGWLRASF